MWDGENVWGCFPSAKLTRKGENPLAAESFGVTCAQPTATYVIQLRAKGKVRSWCCSAQQVLVSNDRKRQKEHPRRFQAQFDSVSRFSTAKQWELN